MKTKAKKINYTEEELTNDRSLKFCPYRYMELVWSDKHQDSVRFMRYEKDGRVKVASLNAMAPLRGFVNRLEIRRLTAG